MLKQIDDFTIAVCKREGALVSCDAVVVPLLGSIAFLDQLCLHFIMCTPFFFPSHHPLTNTLNFDADPDITQPNVTVRLAGSLVRYAGRVEVYTLGYWGTVCDDAFDLTDANIVCRELGYSGALVVSFFGQGGGVIALDEVACEGDETSILQCPHNGLFNHDCIHSEDVGVVCNVGGKMAMVPL